MTGARCAWLFVLCVAACAVPYVPEPVHHAGPLPDDAYDVVLEVLRERYGRIAESHRQAFRVQTAWAGVQHGDIPGRRRASVFKDADGRLQVVVEIYFMYPGPCGIENSAIEGDRRAERALAATLQRALAAR